MKQPVTTPCLVDIGANLTHDAFAGDLAAVMARAAEAGVTRMMVTGASREGSRQALALARQHEPLFATAGNHPHHASEHDASLQADLRTWAADPLVRAVGETGLDYFRDFSPRPAQRDAFEAQLALAVETGKPVFLHQRDAHPDFFAMMREWRDRLDRAVVHCFTDTQAALHDYLDLDLHIGITGWICDERRGVHLAGLVRDIPRGRLMIETDAPYLLPRDLRPRPRSRRNEPAFLAHIAQAVARHRGETFEELARHTSATAEAFFDLPGAADAG